MLYVTSCAGLCARSRIERGDVFVSDYKRVQLRFSAVFFVEVVIGVSCNCAYVILADLLSVVECRLNENFVVL